MVSALIKWPFYGLAFVLVVILLDPLHLEPEPHDVPTLEKFDGPLAVNNKLNEAKLLHKDKLFGPESLALLKGEIYTGTADGFLVKLPLSPSGQMKKISKIGESCAFGEYHGSCSRPLGIRADSKGLLWIADAFKGIYTIDPAIGHKQEHVLYGQKVGGKPITFPDDLDIDESRGVVYFSDATTKWRINQVPFSILEHDCSGRIIQYTIATKELSILADNLCFPNGVQLTSNKEHLLVSDFLNNRILRIPVKVKGKPEVWIDSLPGPVDNLRPSGRGTYWLALGFAHSPGESRFSLHRMMAKCALTTKFLGTLGYMVGKGLELVSHVITHPLLEQYKLALKNGGFWTFIYPHYGMVLEVDANGKILRSLHSPDGSLKDISEVLETKDGSLYIGSYINPYLGYLKL